jgi:hypothetical protein
MLAGFERGLGGADCSKSHTFCEAPDLPHHHQGASVPIV